MTDSSIRPFAIDVPQSELDDLRDRLARTRWPDELPGVGWTYGIPLGYVRELAEYWRTSYDWRKHEARINQFAQFKADIDGVDIHFIHERGKGSNPTPILLTHGWPDSFYRFHKIIPLLLFLSMYWPVGKRPKEFLLTTHPTVNPWIPR
jgi:hypothetical protein